MRDLCGKVAATDLKSEIPSYRICGIKFGCYVLTQVLDLVERKTLRRLAERYNIRVRHFGCRQQLICMGFAQLTWRERFRDIEEFLNAKGAAALYHLGLREPVARVTLAEANEQRDRRLWQHLATGLIKRARRLYAGEDLGLDLDRCCALQEPLADRTVEVAARHTQGVSGIVCPRIARLL